MLLILRKVEAVSRLRKKLQNGETCLGMFVSLRDASTSEIATAVGLDWVLIDCEHGERYALLSPNPLPIPCSLHPTVSFDPSPSLYRDFSVSLYLSYAL